MIFFTHEINCLPHNWFKFCLKSQFYFYDQKISRSIIHSFIKVFCEITREIIHTYTYSIRIQMRLKNDFISIVSHTTLTFMYSDSIKNSFLFILNAYFPIKNYNTTLQIYKNILFPSHSLKLHYTVLFLRAFFPVNKRMPCNYRVQRCTSQNQGG